jgi:branched-chain amino acid transport system substrate-binding protein
MAANPYPPTTQKVLDAYVAKHGRDRWWGSNETRAQISIATTVLTGYDCINLLATAIEKAGSTEAAAIVAAMETITNFTGAAIENISFSASDHDALTTDGLALYEMQSTASGLSTFSPSCSCSTTTLFSALSWPLVIR